MSLAQKRENFRKQIRMDQIQKYMHQERKKFLFKDQLNYDLLKNINLNQQIEVLKNISLQDLRGSSQNVQKAIRQICLYGSSSQKSHLFCHFNQNILNKIAALIEINLKFLNYQIVQQLLVIMVQYADYGYDIPVVMVKILNQIWNQHYDDPIDENRMRVISFLMNLSIHFQQHDQCLESYILLIEKLFRQFPRYTRLLLKSSSQNFKKISIQRKIVQFIQLYINILRISYEKLPSNNFIEDLTFLLDYQKNPLQQTVSIKMQKYIVENLKQIVLLLDYQHQFQYLLVIKNSLQVWARHLVYFYKKYSGNRQNGQYYSILPPLFQLISAVINVNFAVNNQEEDQRQDEQNQFKGTNEQVLRTQAFENVIQNIFKKCICPLKSQILRANDSKIEQLYLRIIAESCQYQFFCQLIMDDHKDMIIRLMRHLRKEYQSSIRLKKLSVQIICSLITNLEVNEDQQYVQNIFNLVKQGKLVQLLTNFLDSVEDTKINNAIIQAIQLLILQENKKFISIQQLSVISDQNFIVAIFQENNGFKKLREIYQRYSKLESKNQNNQILLKTCQVLLELLRIKIE